MKRTRLEYRAWYREWAKQNRHSPGQNILHLFLIPVSTRAEMKILFHAVEHVTTTRDQTSHDALDFKQATQPSERATTISFPVCGERNAWRDTSRVVLLRRPVNSPLFRLHPIPHNLIPLPHRYRCVHANSHNSHEMAPPTYTKQYIVVTVVPTINRSAAKSVSLWVISSLLILLQADYTGFYPLGFCQVFKIFLQSYICLAFIDVNCHL